MTLKAVTINAGLLLFSIFSKKIFEFTPHSMERFKGLVRELQNVDADFLFLQEVYCQLQKRQLITALKGTFPYSHFQKIRSRKPLDSGLLTLSRHPFKKSEHKTFQNMLFEERLFSTFGYLKSEVQVNRHSLWVYNTHLTAGGLSGPENPRTHVVRERQLREIERDIAGKPAICAGDWNCGPKVSSENFQQIQNIFPTWDRLSSHTWDPTNPLNKECPHSHCPPQKIDHVFATDHFKMRSARRLFDQPSVKTPAGLHTVSDHYGIEIHLES